MRVTFLFLLVLIQGFAAFNLTWGVPAVSLDAPPPQGDTDASPMIALAPSGDAIAVWTRTVGHGASEDIWMSAYHHASRLWTGPLKISGGASAAHPRVALDEQGNALFVWQEGFPSQVLSRILNSDGIWTPPLDLPPTPVCCSSHAQITPHLALNKNGNALVLWAEFSGGKTTLHTAKKKEAMLFPELSWIPLGLLTSSPQSVHLPPSKALATNAKEEALAVFEEQGDAKRVFGIHYQNNRWGSPFLISANNAETPLVLLNDEGRGLIVWNEGNQIFSKTWNEKGLSEPLLVSDPMYPALNPDIGLDQWGNAVAVFERYDALHKFIASSSFGADAKEWSSPLDLSGPSIAMAVQAGYPVLSLNPLGDGVVIWKDYSGSHLAIQAAGYSMGTWSFIKTLSSPNRHEGALFPTGDMSVAINPAGNVVAVWSEDPALQGSHAIKATVGSGLAHPAPLPPIPPSPVVVPSLAPSPPIPMPPARTEPNAPTWRSPFPFPPASKEEGFLWGVTYGRQILHRFPAHGDLINILNWTPRADVAYYNIYRGHFSNLIGSTQKPYFEDHQRIPHQKEIYLITSVDNYGQESSPITLIVNPM